MRLNRKWLYLGGLITMLTLLLTLTWVLPAGAVGQLDDGTLSTERSAVNPSPELPDEVTTGTGAADLTLVTLANDALDKTSTVEDDGDFGAVIVTVKKLLLAYEDRVITVDISKGLGTDDVDLSRKIGDAETNTEDAFKAGVRDILPITSDVTIDTSSGATEKAVADAVDSIFVINATDGIIEFIFNADVIAGKKIYLSYNTSPQETALVNVAGDNANFDLLTVEGVDTPGQYAASFRTKESLTLNTEDMIDHEQHAVPSGLRGFVKFEREAITKRYTDDDLKVSAHANDDGNDTKDLVPADTFYVQVANPPIRNVRDGKTQETFAVTTDAAVVTAMGSLKPEAGLTVTKVDPIKGIVQLTVDSDNQVRPGDSIELTYTGSDDFFVTVNHGPIQDKSQDTLLNVNAGDPGDNIVVPSTNNTPAVASSMFRVISIENAGDTCWDCRVRIGVITGNDPEVGDDPTPLNSRISVLGISYFGSERILLPSDAAERREFTATLDEQPADTMAGTDGVQPGILVVGAGSDSKKYVEKLDEDVFTATASSQSSVIIRLGRDDNSGKGTQIKDNGNQVDDKFTLPLHKTVLDRLDPNVLDALDVVVTTDGIEVKNPVLKNSGTQLELTIAETVTTAAVGATIKVEYRSMKPDANPVTTLVMTAVTPPTTTTGTSATFTLKADAVVGENAYIDVIYARGVGSNPQNALTPVDALGKVVTPRPEIAVSSGSRATITSGNDRVTVDAEVDGPTFSNQMPAESAGVATATATLSIDVNDEVSGVDMDSIGMVVAGYTVANEDLTITASGAGYRVSIDLDDVKTSGKDTLSIDATKDTTVEWSVSAKDIAGNYSASDGDSKTKDVNEKYMFKVDGVKAKVKNVYTGDWFDQAEEKVKGDRRLRVGAYLPGASDTSSVRIVFDEVLDGSTVDATDFTVDGAAPAAATWYGTGKTGSADKIGQSVFLSVAPMAADATPTVAIVGSVSDKAGNATTTGSKQAQDGIAPTPTVTVDKNRSDEKVQVTVNTDERIRTLTPSLGLFVADSLDRPAGTSEGASALDEQDVFTVGYEDADDTSTPLVLRDGNEGIVARDLTTKPSDSPTEFSFTLSKAPILDRSGGVVGGVVDEGDIGVSVANVSGSTGTAVTRPATTDPEKETVTDAQGGEIVLLLNGVWKAGDRITVIYRGTDPDPAGSLSGVPSPAGKQVSSTSWTFDLSVSRPDRFAVTATVEDSNRNRGIGGSMDANDANATVFEIDNELAGGVNPSTGDITHDPSGNRPVSTSEPFFIELTWDGERGEYPGDTSSRITLTKAMLDGEDVLTDAVRQNNQSYRISITGIALGAHTLTYNAEDDLGNAHLTDRVLKFTVQAVPTWDLGLSAGMNLISLPSSPANGDINEVFGATEQIDLIYTFEGTRSMVAVRNQDTGDFVGTLNTIDAKHAYWVSVSNAVTVPISIPQTSQLVAPPYLGVIGGQWNLVPVLSLGKVEDDADGVGAAPGTKVDADVYLGDFRTAFGWTGKGWNKIDPDADTLDTRLTNFRDDGVLAVGKGYWVLYDQNGSITP